MDGKLHMEIGDSVLQRKREKRKALSDPYTDLIFNFSLATDYCLHPRVMLGVDSEVLKEFE